MKTDSLVSVIIIFLNGERFIQEAIESVFAQTYDNWELLLVDDGSTDSSTKIALQYAEKLPRKVRYLEHEGHKNCGKSTSRNLGISNAQGQYITFLDADDIFLPSKLEKQLSVLKTCSEAAMVCGNTLYWHSWTGRTEDSQRDYVPQLGAQTNVLFQPPSLLQLLLEGEGAIPCICSFIVRKDVVKEIGGFEESIQHLYEDQVFLAKFFLKAPVFIENGCWERYRQHDGSSWHQSLSTGEDYGARLTFLTWLEKYLIEQRINDPEICQSLQKQLWPYRYPILSGLKELTQLFIEQVKALAK